jgi:prepilin-type N-terminal cleavage/methylation domain-containing protein
MKNNMQRQRGFTLVELLVVITIIAALAGIATPMILNARKAGARTDAMSNARQLGMSLVLFAEEFGSFPDQTTGQNITQNLQPDIPVVNGNTSNAFLSQLLSVGILDAEDVFFAQMTGTRKPDNVVLNNQALQQGECGFAYVMRQGNLAQSPYGNAARPLLATPVIQQNWQFDPEPYDEKAVILKLDNSVDTPRIRTSDGQVSVNGVTLGQVGPQTVWGNMQPQIVLPDLIQ